VLHAFAGTPFVSKGNKSVKSFVIQNHLMLHISNSFQFTPRDGTSPVDVYSSMVITELDNYLVAWGFMSGNASVLEELETTQIQFARAK
jgi:hypothetical protein